MTSHASCGAWGISSLRNATAERVVKLPGADLQARRALILPFEVTVTGSSPTAARTGAAMSCLRCIDPRADGNMSGTMR